MKNPLLIVGLLLAVGAGIVGGMIVLGKSSSEHPGGDTAGINLPADIHDHDHDEPDATVELPQNRPIPSSTGPWPIAKPDKTRFDFGRMAVNAKNQHTFVIRNTGDADLVLKEGKPTCKCTTFALESRTLKPGEETKLVIDWKAGPSADRGFSHGGDVFTNDPKRPAINFGVTGAIEMPVEILPNIWNVGAINLNSKGLFQASIGSSVTDKLEIEPIESPSGNVIVTVRPMTDEELSQGTWVKGFRVEGEIAADIAPGKFEEEITFNVKGIDEMPSLIVPVTARKHGSFILQPLEGAMFVPDKLLLQLGSFPASTGRTARLLVIVDEKDMTEPFQISEIEADPPFITASLQPIGVPTGTIHRYAMEISVPSGRPRTKKTESQPGHITIHTNHPSKETIFTDVLLHSH
jgi:hypothetical protein